MNDGPESMLSDKRTIESVHFMDADQTCYMLGYGGVTAIEVYGEPGMYCNLPYIRIVRNGNITSRFPAGMVRIIYGS